MKDLTQFFRIFFLLIGILLPYGLQSRNTETCSNKELRSICTSRTGDFQRLQKNQDEQSGKVFFNTANKSYEFPVSGEKSFFSAATQVCSKDTYQIFNKSLYISYGKATYGNRAIYDIENDYLYLVNNESIECSIDWNTHFAPLSLIGSVFSFEVNKGGSYGCGPMEMYHMVLTIDLDSGKPVSITEFVDEKDLITALKTDKFLRTPGENQDSVSYSSFIKAFDKAQNLTELSPLIKMKYEFQLDSMLCHYIFLSYDSSKNLVAFRLFIQNREIPQKVDFFQIGLITPLKEEKKKLFLNLKDGTGFFAGRYPNSLVRSKKSQRK